MTAIHLDYLLSLPRLYTKNFQYRYVHFQIGGLFRDPHLQNSNFHEEKTYNFRLFFPCREILNGPYYTLLNTEL